MTAPFVVSMKFTSDASGVKATTGEIRQEIGALGGALEASQTRAKALNSALESNAVSIARYAEQAERVKTLNASGINSALKVRDDFGAADRGRDIEAYGRQLDDLRAKYNPIFALEQRRVANIADITRAQKLGAISAQEMASAVQIEEAAYARSVAAINNSTEALQRNQVVAAKGSSPINTANVAAQFQDIAVTSAMGMSPIQIALQQGTQLSSVLGGQGLTGVVRTLGAAFTSILSPVSLLTIGAVALGAAGLQALGGLFKGAESASDALERHNEWLDKVLAGYESVRDAASDALDASLKLPQDSAESDVGAQRATAANSAVAAMKEALDLKLRFEGELANAEFFSYAIPPETLSSLREMNELIQSAAADSALSRGEIDELHVALTRLGNTTSDTALKSTAREALALVDAARQAFAQVDSLDAALRSIPRDVQIRIQVSQLFNSTMDELGDLYIDPRSRFEVAREQAKNLADQAVQTAGSYGQVVGAAEEYERVISSIDKAEAEASAKTGARAAKSAATAAAKPFNEWKSATDNFQERIEKQQLEISLLGQSTYEVERQMAAFDLLNQAKDAGIPITEAVTDQINTMSADLANSTVQLQQQQQTMSMMEGAASSVADALEDGKLEMSEILDISIDVLEQFIQMQQLGGSSGGGGNWLSSLIGGITGAFSGNFMGGTAGAPALKLGYQTGVRGWANGGWTGGREGQVVGDVHGEEFVVRAGPAAQHRPLLEALNSGGTIGSGFTFSPVTYLTIGDNAGVSRSDVQQLLDERDRIMEEQFNSKVAAFMDNPRRAA
jgi:hypothetical protein